MTPFVRRSARADFLVGRYLDDLTDEEILLRPVPDANHIAWQLGHLITAERHLVEAAAPGSMPELPAGFAERHARGKPVTDNAADYLTKNEYLPSRKTFAKRRSVADRLTPAELDKPIEARVPPWVKKAGERFHDHRRPLDPPRRPMGRAPPQARPRTDVLNRATKNPRRSRGLFLFSLMAES